MFRSKKLIRNKHHTVIVQFGVFIQDSCILFFVTTYSFYSVKSVDETSNIIKSPVEIFTSGLDLDIKA